MRLKKHNPALLPPAELIKQFVARKNDLDILIKIIQENIGRKANQHIMFIGSRGMGKTTLIMRAVAQLHNIKTLNDYWLPVVMAEESYVVGNAGEFWLEAILRLAERLESYELDNIHNKLLDESDNKILYEKALGALLDFADKHKKRLIVFVENFNMLFNDKQLNEKDGWLLRETLINEPRIMMVATATSRFDQIENINLAMFELFAVRELSPLSLNDCKNIWNLITNSKVSERRIRPIEILTGGNPRLLVILSSFAANNSFKMLIEDLESLIDDHTDYLKSNTESLPPLERKVFVSLADIWEPATAKDIGKSTRLNVNSASNQLIRLVKRGAVVVQRVEGKKKYYQLAERLYNIYHQMRRRGGQSGRVKTAVKFMINYYEDDKLCHMVNSISKECVKLTKGERRDHLEALDNLIDGCNDPEMKKRLISSLEPEIFNCHDKSPGLRLLRKETCDEQSNSTKQKVGYGATPIKGEFGYYQNEDSNLTQLAGFIKRKPGIIEKALREINNCSNSKLKNNYLTKLAEFYFNKDNENKQMPDQIKEDDSGGIYDNLVKLGAEFEENGQFDEAKQALEEATTIDPAVGDAWSSLGRNFAKQKQLKKAETHYTKAIDLDPDNARYYYAYAIFLTTAKTEYDKAGEYFQKSVNLEPQNVNNLVAYAVFLTYIRKEYVKAEEYFKKAIDLAPHNTYIYSGYCLWHIYQMKYDLAQEMCKDMFPSRSEIYNCESFWGRIFYLLGRFDYAMQLYENVLTNAPNNWYSYNSIGCLYLITGSLEKAKTSFSKALDLSPAGDKDTLINANIGLVLGKFGQFEEALQYFNKAMANFSIDNAKWDEVDAIVRLCRQLNLSDYYLKAEKWINLAREASPGHSGYAHTHAVILAELGNWDKALEAIEEFLENDKFASHFVGDITAFFIHATRAGHAGKSLELLNNSPSSQHLEPLIVALQKHLGQQTNAPLEVYEVAKDIVAEINKES